MYFGKIFPKKNKQNPIWIYMGILVFSLFNASIIYQPFIPENITLELNDISPKTIFSPRYLAFESSIDKRINEESKKQIAENIIPVYSINQSINHTIIENLNIFFDIIITNQTNPSNLIFSQFLSPKDIQTLKKQDPTTLKTMKSIVIDGSNRLLNNGIKEVASENIEKEIKQNSSQLEAPLQVLLVKIIMHYIRPNITLDKAQTSLITEQTLNAMNRQKTVFKQGQPILYQNEQVTLFHIEVFKALKMYNQKAQLLPFLGIFLITLLNFIILERFMALFFKKGYSFKKIILTGLIITILVFISIGILSTNFIPKYTQMYALIPIPIASMLVTLLVSSNISLMTGTIISIFITIMFQFQFEVFIFLFIANCISSFLVLKSFKRSDLIYAGYKIGVINSITLLCLGLLTDQTHYNWYAINALFGFGNGIFSAMIALAIFPYLEHSFRITTNQTLLELSNLNHPLMRRLMMHAPGTYQHSLMVANFAEAAAEAIGANAILCRVGSYFHDIGKLKRPIFFYENQFSKENPHNSMTPRISKMIIISHVKEGLELAKKHHLPDLIQDIIAQHHGTSLLSVFYTQAIQKDPSQNDESFRYPGPKPQTKEAGILMLADSVEASTRALDKPSTQSIENTIENVFKSKLDDHQLSECPLSMNEIFLIKSTFLYLFKGMQHNRLDYQKEIDKLTNSKP